MLPNWLYGKSKSKLQEILGGGGGGSTYTAGDGIDISNGVISFDPETTPVIDPSKIDGLDDDLAALAPKTALSNPNILHNPWFTVNQRGATSVTASNGFIADRWRIYTTLASFEVTRNSDGYIVIDNTSGDAIITVFQKRTSTYIKSLHGKKVTASVMFSDGTIKSGSITFDSTQSGTYYSDDDYALNYNPTSGSILAIVVRAGKTATIKALKLEVGEISTLHLDPRPEYATELAKCQRYFIRLKNQSLGFGAAESANTISAYIQLPSAMRTKPNVTIGERIGAVAPNGEVYAFIKNAAVFSGDGTPVANIGVTLTGDDTIPAGTIVRLYCSQDRYIDFDAEL